MLKKDVILVVDLINSYFAASRASSDWAFGLLSPSTVIRLIFSTGIYVDPGRVRKMTPKFGIYEIEVPMIAMARAHTGLTMEETTPDNTVSTPQRRTRAREAGINPQRLQLSPGSSTISSITTAGTSRRRLAAQHAAQVGTSSTPHDGTLTLAQLANSGTPMGPWSNVPAIQFDPVAFENAFDRRAHDENAGASDSEDGGEDDVSVDGDNEEEAAHQEQGDARMVAMEDNMVADIAEEDFVPETIVDSDDEDLYGAPAGWEPPPPPKDWKANKVDTANNEPADFASIDNPGKWSMYSFQPKFQRTKAGKKGGYMYHAQATGVTPVPANADNVNAISERASLDLCGDETSFGHQGHGEPDSGLLVTVKGKPKITKGMQTVILDEPVR